MQSAAAANKNAARLICLGSGTNLMLKDFHIVVTDKYSSPLPLTTVAASHWPLDHRFCDKRDEHTGRLCLQALLLRRGALLGKDKVMSGWVFDTEFSGVVESRADRHYDLRSLRSFQSSIEVSHFDI